ncbi:MAG: sel1 repeat family protein [Nitrospira sp. LK70]|nr:sel1 repeat family protein [Nitrospira sp. LK70]
MALSCASLGQMYQEGNGVKQDDFEAADLYQKACEGGYAIGCHSLGGAYLEGRGRPQDEGDALKYLRRGCELRNQQSCGDYSLLKKGKLR